MNTNFLWFDGPHSFESLVTPIETIDPKNLTLDFVKCRILDEWSKRSSGSGLGGSKKNNDSVAMNAAKKKPTGKCYNCGKPGHYQFDCRSKKKSDGNANVAENARKPEGNMNAMRDDGATSLCAITSTNHHNATSMDVEVEAQAAKRTV